jgi:3' exoribonuclease, RNase T-like
MTHVMLDLETYGVAPGCPVLSIGAVMFNGGVQMLPKYAFYGVAKVDQSAYGLVPEEATVKWWEQRDAKAREVLTDPLAVDLPILLGNFCAWLPADALVWGNGADFDQPILAYAIRAAGGVVPWKPYNGRCYRTLKNLAPSIKLERQGTHHQALDDAACQAKHLIKIVEYLGITLG